MPDLYGFTAGIAFISLVYGARVAFLKVQETANHMKESAALLSQMRDVSDKLVRYINTFESASVDNDKAANLIAKSAVQMQDMLVEIKAIMMPEPTEPAQVSIPHLQASFLGIQKELIEQGLDPETAKWKAADYELEKIASGDLTEISMSL